MQHPRFRSGDITTGFIAEEFPQGFHGAATSAETLRHIAAIAGFIATARADRARQIDGQLARKLAPPSDWQIKLGGQTFAVSVHDGVSVDGVEIDLAMEYTPGDRMVEADIGDDAMTLKIEPTRSGLKVTTRGAIHKIEILPAHIAPLAAHMIEKIPPDLSKFLICPMPGLLVTLNVKEGDRVEAGQPLAVVEAMKMENILRAEKSATVKKLNAKAGESLAVDAVILELE
jgi:propionyl-CoA carboxylase alpha chain